MTERGFEQQSVPLRASSGTRLRRVRSADAIGGRETSGVQQQAGRSGAVTSGVDPAASLTQAVPRLAEVGRLLTEGAERMTLHTPEALQLFLGRPAASGQPAIAGGRRFAASMRVMWSLSSEDNPYVDWLLIRTDAQLRKASTHMQETSRTYGDQLQRLRDQGLCFGGLASSQPAEVNLEFGSPYGYATARVVVEYDHHVRLVRALILRDLLTDEEGRQAVREAGRALRALFLEPIRWEHVLTREDLKLLSRADFVATAGSESRQRVSIAEKLLGVVPSEVLDGRLKPRHSRRSVKAARAGNVTESLPEATRLLSGAAASGVPLHSDRDLLDPFDPFAVVESFGAMDGVERQGLRDAATPMQAPTVQSL